MFSKLTGTYLVQQQTTTRLQIHFRVHILWFVGNVLPALGVVSSRVAPVLGFVYVVDVDGKEGRRYPALRTVPSQHSKC